MELTDTFIDRVELLCQRRKLETCLTQTESGIPAFYDSHHLSLEFSDMSGRLYRRRHGELLQY